MTLATVKESKSEMVDCNMAYGDPENVSMYMGIQKIDHIKYTIKRDS